MRFANIRELRLETNKVLALSRRNGPVVVTRNGYPIALLRVISEDDFDLKIGPLWKRLKIAAERAGYRAKDVQRLLKKVRTAKK